MPALSRTLTLADAAMPRAGFMQNALLVVAAAGGTAAAAQRENRLPGAPGPFTGHTFAVLLSGVLLGARRAFLAQSIYLLEGACGLPFFAGGAAGLAVLAGPTGGYLVAFPFAALVTGALAERAWDRRPVTMFLAMLLGSTVIFAAGLAQLSRFVPADRLVATGLAPFVPGDVIKSALAAIAFPFAWKFVRGLEGK